MILYKYLQSRVQLQTWGTVQYGKGGSRSTMMMGTSTVKSGRSRAWSGASVKQASATFDNWLVVRLTIAFLTLWYANTFIFLIRGSFSIHKSIY